MFDSLADQIKHDEHDQVTSRERAIKYSLIAVLAILLFLALYMAIHLGGA